MLNDSCALIVRKKMVGLMNLEQKLTEEIKVAMKSGNKTRLMALRSLKSLIMNERTRYKGDLTEDQTQKLVSSYRKKMSSAREQYQSAGRDEMVAQADVEIALCEEFLPDRLSTAELVKLVNDAVTKSGASSKADIGKVMGLLMKDLAGKADGNEVRLLVMSRLEE